MSEAVVCVPKSLGPEMRLRAAQRAVEINPMNYAPVERLGQVVEGFTPSAERLAVLVSKYWRAGHVRLTVGFVDSPPADLRRRILEHMNAWSRTADVRFVESGADARVRIARTPGAGHWSYVGTDIDLIEPGKPTMNLDSFTDSTPESEFIRVVRHETGHTLGMPHEHMRRELVGRIDPKKAIRFYGQTQGWSADEVRRQVLTPIEEASLIGTDHADPESIMCYQVPGSITRDGAPILGGADISAKDYQFAGKVYPKPPADAAPAPGALATSDIMCVRRDERGDLVLSVRIRE
jgi:hypothetical protein